MGILRSGNCIAYEKMSINIKEDNGLYDLTEILEELNTYNNSFKSIAMSDYQLFLQGQKEMLEMIIKYLTRICN